MAHEHATKPCPTCAGHGFTPYSSSDCFVCRGSGRIRLTPQDARNSLWNNLIANGVDPIDAFRRAGYDEQHIANHVAGTK